MDHGDTQEAGMHVALRRETSIHHLGSMWMVEISGKNEGAKKVFKNNKYCQLYLGNVLNGSDTCS